MIETRRRPHLVGADLALEALDQVTNCHSGGDGMWVDDDVRGDALACEDHVLLPGSLPR